MTHIKVLCGACLKDVHNCECKDEPEKEHSGHSFNRYCEEVLRFLRLWNILK